MINREQIESILKINGVSPTSPDEQIRSVLLSARYSKDEVDTALMVLRQNTRTNQTRVDGLHKVFRSSEALNASEIADLLGVEVEIDGTVVPESKGRHLSGLHYVAVWVISFLVAFGGILLYMHLHRVGLFHPSVELSLGG